MDAERGLEPLATAGGQALDELLPGEHEEQGRQALRVSLERLGVNAVGDVVAIRVDVIRVKVELRGGLAVAQGARADFGLADDMASPADVQLPVVLVPGTAPDVIRAPDALRHQVVPDGVVSVLGMGRSGALADALAVVGHVLPSELSGEIGFRNLLFRLLHDSIPLSFLSVQLSTPVVTPNSHPPGTGGAIPCALIAQLFTALLFVRLLVGTANTPPTRLIRAVFRSGAIHLSRFGAGLLSSRHLQLYTYTAESQPPGVIRVFRRISHILGWGPPPIPPTFYYLTT